MAKLKYATGLDTHKLKANAKGKVSASALAGEWYNCDKKTRGVVKINIKTKGSSMVVRAYGACTPTPCDWGNAKGKPYAANVSSTTAVAFTATYKPGFAEKLMTGQLENGCLHVQVYTCFKDGSNRSDYFSEGCFCRK